MEQKLIEAKFKKNFFSKCLFLGEIFFVFLGFMMSIYVYKTYGLWRFYDSETYFVYYDGIYDTYGEFLKVCLFDPLKSGFSTGTFMFVIYIGVLSILFASFFWWEMSKCELSVTDRRVVGKASFGKAVELPLNQISAVALGIFSSITVATSSGKVHFWFIQNRSEVHSVLTNVIGKVQVESAYSKNNSSANSSNADELKKFKGLLDSGIITQDEFDQKKKQLLNL